MPSDGSVIRRWIQAGLVVGVIGIGLALLLPAVREARDTARRVQSKNNLKQIGLALFNYHDAYNLFPPGGVFNGEGTGFIGWQVSILPFIDASPLYNSLNFDVSWDDERNLPGYRTPYPCYLNPLEAGLTRDSRGFALSHYAGNQYLLFPNSSVKLDDLTDGKEQTILAGEIFADYLPYAQPGNWRHPRVGIHQNPQSFGCPNSDGALMLMADGRVHWIPKAINLGVFHALGTPAGREDIPDAVFAEPGR